MKRYTFLKFLVKFQLKGICEVLMDTQMDTEYSFIFQRETFIFTVLSFFRKMVSTSLRRGEVKILLLRILQADVNEVIHSQKSFKIYCTISFHEVIRVVFIKSILRINIWQICFQSFEINITLVPRLLSRGEKRILVSLQRYNFPFQPHRVARSHSP